MSRGAVNRIARLVPVVGACLCLTAGCAAARSHGDDPRAHGAGASNVVGSVVTWGHSVVAGAYGNMIPFPTTVGATLDRTVSNYAVDGSQLLSGGADSWGNILQLTTTGSYAAVREQPPPYTPAGEMSVLMTGMNDVGCASQSYPGGAQGSAFLGAIGDSLSTVISRLRATAVFPVSDASVAYGPGWAFSPSTAYSGTGYEVTTTADSPVTITIPSTFPGGTVDFGTMDAPGYGGVWNFVVDGKTAGSLDTAGVASGGETVGMVQRFTGLSAGSHTIVATPVAEAGTTFAAAFDDWQIEPTDPEYVGVILQYDPVSTQEYDQVCGYTPTDADIAALNQETSSVVSQFDTAGSDRVIPIALPDLNDNPALTYTDGLHPNQAGLNYIASQVVSAMLPAAPPGPYLTTGAAAQVSSSTALLHGTIDPAGYPVDYAFQYGPTIAYGSATTAASAGEGTSATPVSASVSDLTAGTVVHFRLVAERDGNVIAAGQDESFTTAPYAPSGSAPRSGSSTLAAGHPAATIAASAKHAATTVTLLTRHPRASAKGAVTLRFRLSRPVATVETVRVGGARFRFRRAAKRMITIVMHLPPATLSRLRRRHELALTGSMVLETGRIALRLTLLAPRR